MLNHMVKYAPSPALDSVFAALADPTRRRILELLASAELCVTELTRSFSVSMPAISKHLRVLEKAGLITRQRDGRLHRLRLKAEPMRAAASWIAHYRNFWEERLDAFSSYLERQERNERA